MIDAQLSFNQHLDYARESKVKPSSALARMTTNVGRPKFICRLLIAEAMTSILLLCGDTEEGGKSEKGKFTITGSSTQGKHCGHCGNDSKGIPSTISAIQQKLHDMH